MRDEASEWLALAQTDLATAEQLVVDRIYYAAVFFAQQAGEKALKSLWIARRGELAPKTHNLVALSTELAGAEEVIQAAAELAPEYILTRYVTPEVASPADLYDERSAQLHLQAARTIVDWAVGQER
ncbi:MAG: HEPN domain-containing protein [Chloroflexi bacterium]|nr:HEPN domain-containing protein [Chloroflexota bacterium]